jgi:hypothetical protein
MRQAALPDHFAHQPTVYVNLLFEPFEPGFTQGGYKDW